jgi:hypothetical protein
MPPTMPTKTCKCPPGNHMDLEDVQVIVPCVECGQPMAVISGPLDSTISILEELRRRRVIGTRAHYADGHREVITTRRPEAETG